MFAKVKWKGPEDRVCRYCGDTFLAKRPIWRCVPCTKKQVNKHNESRKREPKDKYPFNNYNGEVKRRFREVNRRLAQCMTREEKTLHYDMVFEDIKGNGILQWIIDRRDEETNKANQTKTISRIRNQYPDTRGLTYEEIERNWNKDFDMDDNIQHGIGTD